MIKTEKEYDELYDRIMAFLVKTNPCNVIDGKCTRAQKGGRNFCCGSAASKTNTACKHCGNKGCTADKPMACRLWLCLEAHERLTNSQWEELLELKKEAGIYANENYMFRATKQEELEIAKKYYDKE